jgi:hypothetical protein
MVTTETGRGDDSGARGKPNDYIVKPFTDDVIAKRLLLLGFQGQAV